MSQEQLILLLNTGRNTTQQLLYRMVSLVSSQN